MLRELLDLRSGQPADQVELDVLRRQVVEQPSPLPAQDRLRRAVPARRAARRRVVRDVVGQDEDRYGHWVAEEAPEEMLAALTAFLAPYRDGSAAALR